MRIERDGVMAKKYRCYFESVSSPRRLTKMEPFRGKLLFTAEKVRTSLRSNYHIYLIIDDKRYSEDYFGKVRKITDGVYSCYDSGLNPSKVRPPPELMGAVGAPSPRRGCRQLRAPFPRVSFPRLPSPRPPRAPSRLADACGRRASAPIGPPGPPPPVRAPPRSSRGAPHPRTLLTVPIGARSSPGR